MVTSAVRQIENQVELKIGWISLLPSNVFFFSNFAAQLINVSFEVLIVVSTMS